MILTRDTRNFFVFYFKCFLLLVIYPNNNFWLFIAVVNIGFFPSKPGQNFQSYFNSFYICIHFSYVFMKNKLLIITSAVEKLGQFNLFELSKYTLQSDVRFLVIY